MELPASRGLERAATAVCGLVPLAGLLYFDWNVVVVIFMLWLDAYLASLRLIPAIWYWIGQILLEGKLNEAENAMPGLTGRLALTIFMSAFCLGLGGFAWGILTLPISLTYLYLNILDLQFHRGGLGAVAYDLLFDAPWSIALLAGSRLFQCARAFVAMRAAGPKRFSQVLKAEYGVLFCKSVTLFALAAVATLFGLGDSRSEVIFIAAAIIGLAAIEWYADYWFHRVEPPDPGAALKKKLKVVHGFDGRSEKR
jgi:hypothetical protein